MDAEPAGTRRQAIDTGLHVFQGREARGKRGRRGRIHRTERPAQASVYPAVPVLVPGLSDFRNPVLLAV